MNEVTQRILQQQEERYKRMHKMIDNKLDSFYQHLE